MMRMANPDEVGADPVLYDLKGAFHPRLRCEENVGAAAAEKGIVPGIPDSVLSRYNALVNVLVETRDPSGILRDIEDIVADSSADPVLRDLLQAAVADWLGLAFVDPWNARMKMLHHELKTAGKAEAHDAPSFRELVKWVEDCTARWARASRPGVALITAIDDEDRKHPPLTLKHDLDWAKKLKSWL
jgi:hypothetical protein